MPFLKIDGLNETKEQAVVPDGEYDLVIGSAVEKKSKKDKDMIQMAIQVRSAEYPNAETIFEYINLPHKDDDEKARDFKLRQMKRMLMAFEVEFDDGFDTEDLVGAQATLQVGQREVTEGENKTPTGRMQNFVKWPRFQGEEEETKATDKKAAERGGTTRKRR